MGTFTQPGARRALPDARLAEINHVAATTGNDPTLDTLLLRFHTENRVPARRCAEPTRDRSV
jgi:hypothetical protein